MTKIQQHPQKKTKQKPSHWEIYKTAARPHTLTASLCPCLVSYAATTTSQPTTPPFPLLSLLWILFCITVQLGTNFHNDYADFIRGADALHTRVGQARATAQGWLTPAQTCTAACLSLTVTAVAGITLLHVTQQWYNGWAWLGVVSSIFNAFTYTGGPFPLGYLGLSPNWSIAYAGMGEVFVLLYFGWVAVLFLPYLLSNQDDPADDFRSGGNSSTTIMTSPWPTLWLYATQVGLLATNIIIVNNLRDRHSDVQANKLTTAVRFGKVFCWIEYVACLSVTYCLVVVDVVWMIMQQPSKNADARQYCSYFRLLPFLSLPLAWKEMKAVLSKDGAALNEHVGGAAKVQVAFCLLLSAGLLLCPVI